MKRRRIIAGRPDRRMTCGFSPMSRPARARRCLLLCGTRSAACTMPLSPGEHDLLIAWLDRTAWHDLIADLLSRVRIEAPLSSRRSPRRFISAGVLAAQLPRATCRARRRHRILPSAPAPFAQSHSDRVRRGDRGAEARGGGDGEGGGARGLAAADRLVSAAGWPHLTRRTLV